MKIELRMYLLLSFMAFAVIPKGFSTALESITTLAKNNTISLFLTPNTKHQLQVQIMDLSGHVLMSENFNTHDIYGRIYNLKYLPDGKYFLEIDSNSEIMVKRFSIEKHEVTLLDEEKLKKPSFFKKDKVWTLAALTFGKDALVILMDDRGNELLNESFYAKESISRKYNLSKLESGEYSLKVYIGDKVFSDRMIIN